MDPQIKIFISNIFSPVCPSQSFEDIIKRDRINLPLHSPASAAAAVVGNDEQDNVLVDPFN